jgi:integrase
MTIVAYPQTMSNLSIIPQRREITPAARYQVQHQPLAQFITVALAACGSESENTRRAYTRAWGDFLAYLSDVIGVTPALAREEKNLRPDGKMTKTDWVYAGDTGIFDIISPSLRDGFVQALVDKGYTRATRNQRKNAVNTLLAIAYRDGFINDDLARRLDVRPFKKREKNDEKPVGRRLSPPEVRKLRAVVELQAKTDLKAIRDLAILDVMLYAGLRRSEVANLSPGNLKQDGGRWWLHLTGKGDKTRRVKVHDTLFKSIETWARAAGVTIGQGDEPLFYNLAKGGKLTANRLNSSVIGRLVAEYGWRAGLAPASGGNRLSPHDIRRTAARNAFDNGANLEQVRLMLGHSDPKTTSRYIGAGEQDDNTAVDFVRY